MGASSLDWYDGPAALTLHYKTRVCVAAIGRSCRNLGLLPFRLLRWLLPRA